MNTSWHSYPKVWALGHREVKEIFTEEVFIQEKIDGSQISFGMFDGELKIKSKSKELDLENPERMFNLAVEYIQSIAHKLMYGWTYRGEYLQKPHHNALTYNRIPKNHIIIFDINIGHEEYISPAEIGKYAELLGLESVPILFKGVVADPVTLPEMIKQESYLGGVNMEGIVVKNYYRFGSDKKVLMGKFVGEEFKEVHKQTWKASHPLRNDVVQLLITSLKTDARWLKAVQHCKERGELEGSPRDIPVIMREIDKDLKEECTTYIADKLTEWAMPKIIRGAKAGMPEWYKQYLLEQAYGT